MKKADSTQFQSTIKALKKLEGNLLTLVDSLDLPNKQSEAIKSQVRRLVWQLEMK